MLYFGSVVILDAWRSSSFAMATSSIHPWVVLILRYIPGQGIFLESYQYILESDPCSTPEMPQPVILFDQETDIRDSYYYYNQRFEDKVSVQMKTLFSRQPVSEISSRRVPLSHKTRHQGLVDLINSNCNNGYLMYEVIIFISDPKTFW